MNWIEIEKEESRQRYEEYCVTGILDFAKDYNELRQDLVDLFETALTKIGIIEAQIPEKNYSYQLDLQFGIKLYMTLNQKYGMNVRLAATDGVWRYLCACVVPDIIEKRYGKGHPDRIWKKPKRLWLRVLWWYIYLSWQGTEVATEAVLRNNSTDEILQLVDRCGRGGYRVDLYREFMKKNGTINLTERSKRQLFRKIMVLNTARVQAVEPALTSGGVQGYVENLYDYFQK